MGSFLRKKFSPYLNKLTHLVQQPDYSRTSRSIPWLFMPWLLLHQAISSHGVDDIDGSVQERHNSIANALELCLSCTNPSIYMDIDEFVQERPNSIANALELRLSCTNPLIYIKLYLRLLRGSISMTCHISVSRNYDKNTYIYIYFSREWIQHTTG